MSHKSVRLQASPRGVSPYSKKSNAFSLVVVWPGITWLILKTNIAFRMWLEGHCLEVVLHICRTAFCWRDRADLWPAPPPPPPSSPSPPRAFTAERTWVFPDRRMAMSAISVIFDEQYQSCLIRLSLGQAIITHETSLQSIILDHNAGSF